MSMRFSNFSNKIWEYGVRSTSVICLKFILKIEGNLCLMHANTVQYPKKDVHRQNYFQHTHHQIQLSGCFSQQLQVIFSFLQVFINILMRSLKKQPKENNQRKSQIGRNAFATKSFFLKKINSYTMWKEDKLVKKRVSEDKRIFKFSPKKNKLL